MFSQTDKALKKPEKPIDMFPNRYKGLRRTCCPLVPCGDYRAPSEEQPKIQT